eukprot:1007588-Rhodomonas_salina.2
MTAHQVGFLKVYRGEDERDIQRGGRGLLCGGRRTGDPEAAARGSLFWRGIPPGDPSPPSNPLLRAVSYLRETIVRRCGLCIFHSGSVGDGFRRQEVHRPRLHKGGTQIPFPVSPLPSHSQMHAFRPHSIILFDPS